MKSAARWLGAAALAAGLVAGTAGPARAQFLPGGNPYFTGAAGAGVAGTGVNPYVGAPRVGGMVVPSAGVPGAGPGGTITTNLASPPNPFGTTAGIPTTSGYFPGIYPDTYGNNGGRGSADVINAQGRYRIAEQEALLLRQRAFVAASEARRKIFEDNLAIRAMTPTPEQERQRTQKEMISRAVNDPPAGEVQSGQALNDVLSALQSLGDARKGGAAMPIAPDMLKKVNLRKDGVGGNVGLLRDEGKLPAPRSLRELPRNLDDGLPDTADVIKRLQNYTQRVYGDAGENRIDNGLVRAIEDDSRALRRRLEQHSATMGFQEYTDARKFLDNLDSAVRALGQADAPDMIRGKAVPQGETVQDLVEFMTSRGLRFAPASPGGEGAYRATHQGLVNLYRAASGGAGTAQR